eukprot:scaffold37878_cov107-Attheya_sp.AAC.1
MIRKVLISAHANGLSVAPCPGPRNWLFRDAKSEHANSCTMFHVAPAFQYASHIMLGTILS